ncbi:MAG: zf-HC2 domain-containing protein [Phycisphaerae bacterium]
MTRQNSNPVEADLSAYLDGELSDFERHRIEAQLHKDPNLMEELENVRAAREWLQSLPQIDAPQNFSAAIFDRAPRSQPATPVHRILPFWNPLRLSGFAAALFLCSFAGWYFGKQSLRDTLPSGAEPEALPRVATRQTPAPAFEQLEKKADRNATDADEPDADALVAADSPGVPTRGRQDEVVAARPARDDASRENAVAASPTPRVPATSDFAAAPSPRAPTSVLNISVTPKTAEQYANAIQLLEREKLRETVTSGLEQSAPTVIEQSLSAADAIALLDQFESVAPQQVSYQIAGVWNRKTELLALSSNILHPPVPGKAAPESSDALPVASDTDRHPLVFGYLYLDNENHPVFMPADAPQVAMPAAVPLEWDFPSRSQDEVDATLEERIAMISGDKGLQEDLRLKRELEEILGVREPPNPTPPLPTRVNQGLTQPRSAKSRSADGERSPASGRAQRQEKQSAEEGTAGLFEAKLRQNFRDFDKFGDVFDVDVAAPASTPVQVCITIYMPQSP